MDKYVITYKIDVMWLFNSFSEKLYRIINLRGWKEKNHEKREDIIFAHVFYAEL